MPITLNKAWPLCLLVKAWPLCESHHKGCMSSFLVAYSERGVAAVSSTNESVNSVIHNESGVASVPFGTVNEVWLFSPIKRFCLYVC